MKKALILFFALIFLCGTYSYAQNQQTSVGLGIDFGDGATFVGPVIKHFFKDNQAVQGEVLFGNGGAFINAFYQYHGDIPNAKNLKWYLGGGPSLGLYKGGSDFFLRPMAGINYNLGEVPIAISFDWRPTILIGDSYGSSFTAARFGLGFKYTLN